MSSDIFFAFGPNDSYMFHGPKANSWAQGINQNWREYVLGPGSGVIGSIQTFATDQDTDLFAVWTNNVGPQAWATTNTTKFPNFEQHRTTQGATNTRVCFGAMKNSYVAWSSISAAITWCLVPDGWAFKCCTNLGTSQTRLKCVSLGVEEASFFMASDDRFWYNLGANYTTLDEILKDHRPGDIAFLALNPFRVEQFFLLRADNVAVFRVSLSLRDSLMDLLSKHGIACRDLSSQRANKAPASLPAKTKEAGFLKGIVKDVAVNTFGSVIGGVASALVGAAACTVM